MKSSRLVYVFLFSILSITFNSCNIEPYEGEILEEEVLPVSCTEAIQNVASATTNFANATDANYGEMCSAYKKALQDQIALCGDTDNLIQAIIDSLGECGETTTSAGDYWPMATGNKWVYNSKIDNVDQAESSLEIGGTENYQGFLSYYYDNFFGSVQGTDGSGLDNLSLKYYTRKDNGDYYISVGEMNAELSGFYNINQTSYGYVILKDYLEVGAKWSSSFDVITKYTPLNSTIPQLPNVTASYEMNFEILEKNASVVVNGKTYSSVIKLGFEQKVTIAGFPGSNAIVDYVYYFAKDFGVIKVEGSIYDADDKLTSSVLQELTSSIIN